MTREIAGMCYAANASRRQPARLRRRSGSLITEIQIFAEDGASLAQCRLDEAEITPPLGSMPRKITFADGSVFETSDHDAFAEFIGDEPGRLLHQFEKPHPRLIAVVFLCLAAGFALWRYGLDILATVAIAATPPVVVEQIDAGTMRSVDFTIAEPSDLSPDEKDRTRAIYDDLLASLPAADREAHSFDLQFRDLPGMGPNAFALPGGTLVMTDELIEAFPDDDVIAAVLAHEMGHVIDQHGLKRLYRSLGAAILIAYLMGDTAPMLEDIILEGNVLLSLSYSRAQERDADAFALRLSSDAGYDPAALKSFFEHLLTAYGDDSAITWMSTHPSSRERIDNIEAGLRELGHEDR